MNSRRFRLIVAFLSILAVAPIAWAQTTRPAAKTVAPPAPAEIVVASGALPWHTWMTSRTMELLTADGKLVPLYSVVKGEKKPVAVLMANKPADGWFAPAFDDSGWARYAPASFKDDMPDLSMLCARKRFQVDDPAAVRDLKLSASYIGGIVVYVNGREVARGHIAPGQPVSGDTLAEPYPADAYESKGARGRELNVAIPSDALVKGVNVLAAAVVRAPVREMDQFIAGVAPKVVPIWPHARLSAVKLSAAPGSAVVAEGVHPKGVCVWAESAAARRDMSATPEPGEPVGTVRLVASRNGIASGQILVSSVDPITGISAVASELKRVGGGALPASQVQIRWPLPDLSRPWYHPPPPAFDSLVDAPPAKVSADDKRCHAVQPVWITLNVPGDAAPGDYSGVVTVKADNLPAIQVPVQVRVHGFRLPNALDFTPHVGLIQSPESIAIQYGVEMWSPRHWELIERSFKLMALVGNKTIYLPMVCKTNFGNDESMVRWIKDAQGKWSCDFSIVDKYLDIATKHLGKPPVVCLYVYEGYMGKAYFGQGADKAKTSPPLVTVLDPATGKLAEMAGPEWTDPDIVAFWKPMFDGMRERLAKRGLADSMMMGMNSDCRPCTIHEKVMLEAAPNVPWVSQAHPFITEMLTPRKIPANYVTCVWNSGTPVDPAVRRPYGWKGVDYRGSKFTGATFPREGGGCIGTVTTTSPLQAYRAINEAALTSGINGFGRTGADFWRVIPSADKRDKYAVSNRYSSWAQLNLSNGILYVLGAAPDGPVSTLRYEMVREGVQTAEARVFLERILTDPARKAELGEDLAARCQRMLDDRTNALRRAYTRHPYGSPQLNAYTNELTSLDDQLFALAAEAQAKTK